MTAIRKKGSAKMGRPKGSGAAPGKTRRNRVVTMLTDAELAKLEALAEERGLPLGTVAYQILSASLRRRK